MKLICRLRNEMSFSHKNLFEQAWRGRKRQARGHHSPSSIQGEWLAIDDRKITL